MTYIIWLGVGHPKTVINNLYGLAISLKNLYRSFRHFPLNEEHHEEWHSL
jgi:hypothetical protein